MNHLFLSILVTNLVVGIFVSEAYAQGNDEDENEEDEAETLYFSMEPLDNWIYETYSDSHAAQFMGFGPSNAISLYPNVFDVETINEGNGVYSTFKQDSKYSVKNAPLNHYVKSEVKQKTGLNVTLQENTMIDGEEAIKVHGNGIESLSGLKYIFHYTMFDGEPYQISYYGDAQNFDKYLPEFEQMVQSFKFKN